MFFYLIFINQINFYNSWVDFLFVDTDNWYQVSYSILIRNKTKNFIFKNLTSGSHYIFCHIHLSSKNNLLFLYTNMSDMCNKKVFGRWQYQFKIPCITYYRKQKIDKKCRNVSCMVSNQFPISVWRFCFIIHIACVYHL